MILLALLLQFFGFYLWYNTSQRADLQTRIARGWIQKNRRTASVSGAVLIALSYTLLSFSYSTGTSLLIGTVSFMMISTLVVILFPLKSL